MQTGDIWVFNDGFYLAANQAPTSKVSRRVEGRFLVSRQPRTEPQSHVT
jgi:hypothetical protein